MVPSIDTKACSAQSRTKLPSILFTVPLSLITLLLVSCSSLQTTPSSSNEFKDCRLCPRMVNIPAGSFQMGDLAAAGRSNEQPVREISVEKPFALSKHPITIAEFRHFVEDTGYVTEAERSDGCWSIKTDKSVGWVASNRWDNTHPKPDDNHPAVCLNVTDVRAYTDWLSARSNADYRLPTEAEWEYAARAGTTTKYVFGDKDEDLCLHMNWSDDQTTRFWDGGEELLHCDDNFLFTSPVGSFPPNNFGLYDMYGNVWEWVADCYEDNLNKIILDQQIPAEQSCELNTLRGGSWAASLQGTTSSYRISAEPTMRTADYGFRVLREF